MDYSKFRRSEGVEGPEDPRNFGVDPADGRYVYRADPNLPLRPTDAPSLPLPSRAELAAQLRNPVAQDLGMPQLMALIEALKQRGIPEAVSLEELQRQGYNPRGQADLPTGPRVPLPRPRP